MINFSLTVCILAGLITGPAASQEFDYFGVTPPGETPDRFPFETVVPEGFEVGNPIWSPDGTEFYFADGISKNIFVMKKSGTGWSDPVRASFSDAGRNLEQFITQDNKTIYFNSTRPPGNPPMNGRIWRANRLPSGEWAAPELVIDRDTQEGFWYPFSPAPGILYFGATLDDSFGEGDFYRATEGPDGWSIEHLPAPFNTPDFEWDPYFSSDGGFMLFQSRRPDGFGATDIYISFRNEQGYGDPINIGAPVNTERYETAATISPDGAYMIYTVAGGGLPPEVRWVSTKVLTRLKPT